MCSPQSVLSSLWLHDPCSHLYPTAQHWMANSHSALGPGWSLWHILSPSSWQTPFVCEMRPLSPLRVGKEFLEEEPAGPCNWVGHTWLSHTHPSPHLPIPLAPSSLQAVSEVWKQERVSPDPIFSSPTSLCLKPFVSEKPFGVLCLFFPSSTGNYSECVSMCFP